MKFIAESTSVNPAKKNQKFNWEGSGMSVTIGEKAITEQVINSALYGRNMTNGRSVRSCLDF
jgi:hypothetical protein